VVLVVLMLVFNTFQFCYTIGHFIDHILFCLMQLNVNCNTTEPFYVRFADKNGS